MNLRFLLAVFLYAQYCHLHGQTQVQAVAETKGARIAIPAGWGTNRALAEAGGPISLNNFRGVYDRGGIVPAGGAEIEVTSVAKPSDLTSYIRTELAGTEQGRFEEAVENGKPGIRVNYTEHLATDVQLVTSAFYVPRGAVLYKFYLTYRAGNGSEQDLKLLFSTVIAGAQLK